MGDLRLQEADQGGAFAGRAGGDRAQAQGALKRDEALLAAARIDLTRYQRLAAQDSIAQQQVDTQAALVKQDEGLMLIDQGSSRARR